MQLIIKVKETNENWKKCLEENSLEVGRCLYGCQGNTDCESDCNDDFRARQLECPCEVRFSIVNASISKNIDIYYIF